MPEFRMPSLGADMTEGKLVRWLVRPGDVVHTGDIIAEVDTTKAAIEVECFDDGVVGSILVPEGETVAVGTPLATIEPAAEAAAETLRPPDATRPRTGPASAPEPQVGADHAQAAPVGRAGDLTAPDIHATPLIRQLAAEAGIDLAQVSGTGPRGRVVRADIDRAVAASAGPSDRGTARKPAVPAAEPSGTSTVRASGYARRLAAGAELDLATVAGTGPAGAVRARDVRAARSGHEDISPDTEPEPRDAVETVSAPPVAEPSQHDPAEIRKLIAAAMTRSKRTVPHYYLSDVIDLDASVRWLREVNLRAPVSERILASALLLCATARAAKAVPQLNGHWVDDEFRPASAVHLGVVVSLRGGGIILPTIPDADTLSVAAMMGAVHDVVARSRTARLRSSDAVPAGISVTNLGDMGVRSVFGVIPAPQVAIIGFGAVTERPCAVNGLVGVRPQVTVTLSADHRASDGAVGARFLTTVSGLLQHPEEL